MTRYLVLLTLTALSALATAPTAGAARLCSGSVARQAPGARLTADRLIPQGGTSCRGARTLVARFLSKQARDISCAGAAAQAGYVCLIGPYECEKQGARASCLNQGRGVTFRERDRGVDG